jgi:hypothetical protein
VFYARRDRGGARIAMDLHPDPERGEYTLRSTTRAEVAQWVPPAHRAVQNAMHRDLFTAHRDTCRARAHHAA